MPVPMQLTKVRRGLCPAFEKGRLFYMKKSVWISLIAAVAAIAAAVACLEGGAATVRGIRRLPRHVRIGLVRLRSAVRRPARRAERGKRADDR